MRLVSGGASLCSDLQLPADPTRDRSEPSRARTRRRDMALAEPSPMMMSESGVAPVSSGVASSPVASSVSLPALPPAVVAEHDRAMQWATTELQAVTGGSDGSHASSSASASAASSLVSSVALPSLSSVSGRPMRVNQLDAAALDGELGLMLAHSFRRCFRHFDGGMADHKAELDLVLGALVFVATIWVDQPTPGMKLQNLQLHNYAAIARARNMGNAGGAHSRSIVNGALAWLASLSSVKAVTEAISPVLSFGSSLTAPSTAAAASRMDSLRALLPTHPLTQTALAAAAPDSVGVALSNFDHLAGSKMADAISAVPPAVLLAPLPANAPTLLSRRQKLLYFGGSVLLRYAWSRLTHKMTMEGWGGAPEGSWHRRAYAIARRLEQIYQAANIINFVAFLRHGWSDEHHHARVCAELRSPPEILFSRRFSLCFWCASSPQLPLPPRALPLHPPPLPPPARQSQPLVRVHEPADRVERALGVHALPAAAHQLRSRSAGREVDRECHRMAG